MPPPRLQQRQPPSHTTPAPTHRPPSLGAQAAASLLQQQQLPVDFEFYQASFPMDCPCLVLSAGRSLLKDVISVQLPLRPTGEEGGGGGTGRDQWAAAAAVPG